MDLEKRLSLIERALFTAPFPPCSQVPVARDLEKRLAEHAAAAANAAAEERQERRDAGRDAGREERWEAQAQVRGLSLLAQ